jgi:hypothetical protein
MSHRSACDWLLVALTATLAARPLGADSIVIRDDFVEDPDLFDGQPLKWQVGQNPCCPAQVSAKAGPDPGDGGILVSALSDLPGQVATEQVFAGDVALTVQANRSDAASTGFGSAIHWDPVNIGGYNAMIESNSTVYLLRYRGVAEEELVGRLPFDPGAADLVFELRSIGPTVELRVWPEGGERPASPLLAMENNSFRRGAVALAAARGRSRGCFRWAEVTAPPPCDTHCESIEIVPIQAGGNNVRVTARAADDGGDPIQYLFEVRQGAALLQQIGPQPEPTADFNLAPGRYTLRVSVSDASECAPSARDSVCSRTHVVQETPPPGLQLPGDCNQDRRLDISDALCVFGFLFLGSPETLPCGGGPSIAAGDVALLDWQEDRNIDLSDGIALLQFLFSGGAPHRLGEGCAEIVHCPAACER